MFLTEFTPSYVIGLLPYPSSQVRLTHWPSEAHIIRRYVPRRKSSAWALATSMLRFLDHTQLETHTRAVEFLCTSDQPVAKRPLPTQHTTNTRDKQPCLQQDSNPLSLQSSGRKPTHWTAQPPGSANIVAGPAKLGAVLLRYAAGWSAEDHRHHS